MGNLNNVDKQNEKLHPKPTDDPGEGIETVTPEPKKESPPNDKGNPPEDNKGSGRIDIETVTPDE